MYKKTNEAFGKEFSQNLRNDWKRYLDDCFITWKKNSDLHMLNNILNDLGPDIKLIACCLHDSRKNGRSDG